MVALKGWELNEFYIEEFIIHFINGLSESRNYGNADYFERLYDKIEPLKDIDHPVKNHIILPLYIAENVECMNRVYMHVSNFMLHKFREYPHIWENKSKIAGLYLYLYLMYGTKIFEHKLLGAKINNVLKIWYEDITDYLSYYTRYHLNIFHQHCINNRCLELYKYIFNNNTEAFFVSIFKNVALNFFNILPPTELTSKLAIESTAVRQKLFENILGTKDRLYAPVFKQIAERTNSYYDKYAIYLFSLYLGGEFVLENKFVETKNSYLYKYLNKEISETEFDKIFDRILVEDKSVLRCMVQMGCGIGIGHDVRITKSRYKRILRIASIGGRAYKPNNSDSIFVGPFYEVDSPFLSIKILRRRLHAK